MKKTFMYISSGIVVLTLLAFFAGKITFEQLGILNSVVLPLIYGIYQRFTNGELLADKINVEKDLVLVESKLKTKEGECEALINHITSYKQEVENYFRSLDSEQNNIKLSKVETEQPKVVVSKTKRVKK